MADFDIESFTEQIAEAFGPLKPKVGANAWFADKDANGPKLAQFSRSIDGTDWFRIFPYQFVIADSSDYKEPKKFKDLVTPPPPVPLVSIDAEMITEAFMAPGQVSDLNPTGAAGIDLKELQGEQQQEQADAEANWNLYLQKQKEYLDQVEESKKNYSKKIIYTLPIPPDGLTVKPIMAQEATATVDAVVEESSPNVFWMITLTGTTGIAIDREDTNEAAKSFRQSLGTTGLLAGVGASLNKLASTATAVLGVGENGAPESIGDVTGNVAEFAQAALLPKLPYASSAIGSTNNGYTEMNLLHRFLIAYGDLKRTVPMQTSLYFINHKDKQQFRVVVKDFQIRKSVSEPYLYRYSITLKGWDLKNPDQTEAKPIDRFKGDLSPVNTLTLTNLNSSLNDLVTNSIGNPNSVIPVIP